MQDLAGLVNQVGEIALQARSLVEFRIEALRCLTKEVGAAGACIFGSRPADATLCDGQHMLEGVPLENRLALSYLADFSPLGPEPQAWRDSDVVPRRVRERAAFYREYLPRLGLRSFAARCWENADGFQIVSLAPQGAVDSARFFRRTQAALDAVYPIIALGERVHAGNETARSQEKQLDDWARGHGLSPAEFKVVCLVERGLTNPEIASMLSLSPNTVRNRLASVFRKLDVSRRAELVYHLGVAREPRR